jgi:hypothetical protein
MKRIPEIMLLVAALMLSGCAWEPMTDEQRAMLPYVLSPITNYRVPPAPQMIRCTSYGQTTTCYYKTRVPWPAALRIS